VAVLLVAGAVVFYFAFLPDILVDDWRGPARREHDKIAEAFPRVFATFSDLTFGADTSGLRQAKTPDAYLREVRLADAISQDYLRDARATIRRGLADLGRVDETALTAPPNPPLIGGSGRLKEARRLAADERRYLALGRDFLNRYERLVDFGLDLVRVTERANVSLAKGLAAIPANPGSPAAYVRSVTAVASEAERHQRKLRRVKPPSEVRWLQRSSVGLYGFYARSMRGFAEAVHAGDLSRFKRVEGQFNSGIKRYRRTGHEELLRLISRSTYSRAIERLNQLGDVLDRAHRHLGTGYSGA
jgi:hypothetical protein